MSDELWDHLEPLLPQRERRFRYRVASRCRTGTCWAGSWLYVLHAGSNGSLPQDLGLDSGMTCWRRLRDWNEAGVWQRPHEVLLAELNAAPTAGLVPLCGRLLPRQGTK
ncbi:transposase [Streptomyces sp. YC419]|uniref:Transposase n=1 Tax=Streptomyces ureilyticus TaxID=1775131 RepID=A0ABX0DX79_9ACTN|nr:transposase [Streptomyces ureilyticus]